MARLLQVYQKAGARRSALMESAILALFTKEERKVSVYINSATVPSIKGNSKPIICGGTEHFNSSTEIPSRASSSRIGEKGKGGIG